MNRFRGLARHFLSAALCVALVLGLTGAPAAFAVPTLAEATDNTYTWNTAGNAEWFGVDSVNAHDMVDYAVSGDIGDLQTSYMEITVNGPGTLSFWYKIESEASWDFLRVRDNGGAPFVQVSGLGSWTQAVYSVPSGSHTIRFSYEKDGSISNFSDSALIDEVSYTNDPPTGRVDGKYLATTEEVLLPETPEAGAQHGSSVAVAGDALIAGSNNDDTAFSNAGSATVYKRSTSGTWTASQMLTAEDESANSYYGSAVAADGDALAIAASGKEKVYTYYDFGAGYVKWGGPIPAPVPNSVFGGSIAISGNTLAVGARNYSGIGRVYVYVYDAGWSLQQTIDPPDGVGEDADNYGDWFGMDVDIKGDRIIVGAPFHDHPGSPGGAAYIYDRSGATWSLTQELTSTRGYPAVKGGTEGMGAGVAIDGDTAVAGDFTEGTVDVFYLDGTWGRTDQLTRPADQALCNFGSRVAIDGDTILVGDSWYDWVTKGGSVFAFARANERFFDLVETIQPAVGDSSAGYGNAIDIEGAKIVVGAHIMDGDAGGSQGKTYAYSGAYYHVMDGGTLNVAPETGVLANDLDPNHDPLHLLSHTTATYGSNTLLQNGSLTYTASAGSPAQDQFVYSPRDPYSQGVETDVYVTIAPPPAGTPQINYGSPLTNNATIDITGVMTNVRQFRTAVGGAWSDWQWYTGDAISVDLPASQGDHDVYFEVRGSGGGRFFNTTLTLDTIAPEVTREPYIAVHPGDAVRLTATDAGSGVERVSYKVDGGTQVNTTGDTAEIPFDTVGVYEIEYWARDNAANESGHVTESVTVSNPTVPLAGTDRYATAVEVSKKSFPAGADTVVIATGRNWPDALGGSALAGACGAPILLCDTHALPSVVADEIDRLGAVNAIILGGTGAVGTEVEAALGTAGITSVDRLGGADRYATARLVAQATMIELGGVYDGNAFVVTGKNYPDALAGSPIAAAKGWPIYLANPTGTPAKLAADMKADGVTDAVVLGGTAVVSDAYESALDSALGTVVRVSGADRYETGVKVATFGVTDAGLAWGRPAIATGQNFPDALAGGMLCAGNGSVMLLTEGAVLSAPVDACLSAHVDEIATVYFLGGTNAVSQTVRDRVQAILTTP